MTNKFLAFLVASVFLASCSMQKIENKNEDGQVTEKFTVNKKTGLREGHFKDYDDKGVLMSEATYKKGEFHGERKLYSADGKVQSLEMYENGIFQGPFKSFYDNGQLKLIGEYVNGEAVGIWKKYYDSGEILEEVTLKDNEENGPFKEYYKNGNLKAEGNYLHGDNEDGLLKMYNDAGELIKTMDCVNGGCKTKWTKE